MEFVRIRSDLGTRFVPAAQKPGGFSRNVTGTFERFSHAVRCFPSKTEIKPKKSTVLHMITRWLKGRNRRGRLDPNAHAYYFHCVIRTHARVFYPQGSARRYVQHINPTRRTAVRSCGTICAWNAVFLNDVSRNTHCPVTPIFELQFFFFQIPILLDVIV